MTEQVIEKMEDATKVVELNDAEIDAVGGAYGNLRSFFVAPTPEYGKIRAF